jgi:hypothetical protein
LTYNTLQMVVPLAFAGIAEKSAEHKALLQDGDLEIIPGWDDMRWMSIDDSYPAINRVILMELALGTDRAGRQMDQLPSIINAHLQRGGRVLVARLYERDHEANPWYKLEKLGWPRSRIKQLLVSFEYRAVATIGGAAFYELRLRSIAK